MKYLVTALMCVVCIGMAHSINSPQFSRIRIFIPDRSMLNTIWSTGIDHEGVTGKPGGPMEFVAGEYELEQLRSLGIPFDIVIDDLAKEAEARLANGPANTLGFGYGSMGGYYTNAEVVRQLDTMRLQYPNLITVRDSIGRTHEGRPIYAVKISDNPGLNEPNEPEVLYTALHHAREPEGMMSVVYYMWWLLENYGTHQTATYLVNNRQLWFIPVLNVDGYVYNQSTNPNGGGNWRKNRRNNGDGTFGVDPNRNYGPMLMWNSSNGGSSTSTSSDTYRGIAPFSEPENQAIDSLMRRRNFKACLNYHTYGNYLIYPFGYLSRENPDSLIYRDWAYFMTADNRFTNGTDLQTVAYATRGNSDDYMYGDVTKPKTWAMTPEVGTTGFWPSTPEILPLAVAQLGMNQFLAYIAGQHTTLARSVVQDAGSNGFIDRGESFNILATIKNRGLSDASNLTYTISSNSPDVQFNLSTVPIATLSPQAELLIVFSGSVASHATTGTPLQLFLAATDQEGYSKIDTVRLYVGTPATVFADSASNGTSNWTTGSGWGLTSNAHTPPSAFTDSPTGLYSANANNSLTLTNQLNLAGYNYAQLRFWTKWAAEPTWDFCTVEVSTNNGSTWATLRTPLAHKGSARSGGQQPATSWGYDSYTPFGQQYLEQAADLTPYVNNQIRLRFRLAADGGEQRDGFYVDDIRVHGYTINQPPDTGIVIQPASLAFSGITGRVFEDSLKINNYTAGTIQLSLAETTSTFKESPSQKRNLASLDLQSLIQRLRPAFKRAHITRESFRSGAQGTDDSPLVYSTIISDERSETGFGAADVYRVQHQVRTFLATTYHDFRIVLGVLPDTNVVGFISIDTDQDFGTGAFPAPFGIGLTSRDIGSEREILFDASGVLIDSLTGIGRIPAGVVLNATADSLAIVGSPFLLSVSRDSVLTITTTNILGLGIRQDWLGDADGRYSAGIAALRLSQGANPAPDVAPEIGHGTIGAETGVSWISEDRTFVTIAPGDSATIRVTALAAKLPGTYNAALRVTVPGRPLVTIPVQLNVTALAQPHISLNATSYHDTLAVGDSTMHILTISNSGNADLVWGALDTTAASWLSFAPAFGTIPAGQNSQLTITVRSGGLTPNTTYTSRVLVLSNDQATGTVSLPISLRVNPLVAVGESDRVVPHSFALRQNYPNPFNPETIISFDLPRDATVSLRIFNLIGEEVGLLIHGRLSAGTHDVRVGSDKFGLTSGVYFYRLSAGEFTQTRKMVLMR